MRFAGFLCTALLLVGACDSKGGSMTKDEQFAELMKRPDIEQIEADYLKLLEDIRTELVARTGIAQWVPKDEPITGSGCGDFPGIGGNVRRYSSGHSPGNLPDAKWQDAVELVESIAGRQGFKLHGAVVDRPDDHEVTLGNDYGAELLFGTAANTTLSISTGCHLTRAAKQRGTPA
ncbi:hypothetical protein AOZ06_33690 [Kibdelosporangium phytohabitans]|uniref:Uncharacterized protein n=2 Tax=Kibdelosporangium phytohabitans TaxID=860235 RepID=A0A0N9I673_9PSEU|nr:hypothetical protein AOZ06_33690 [Kibdelosporangium phytohabitans]